MQGSTSHCNWNESEIKDLASNNWRASLVPAAAVIPAPIAYIKVVAVKKLVVERWRRGRCWTRVCTSCFALFSGTAGERSRAERERLP
jgi:hypothetical protein